MLGRSVEAYAVIPSLHFLTYSNLRESVFRPRLAREYLHYGFIEAQLRKFLEGREGVYAFPAIPQRITPKKFFMQAKGSGYAEFRGALKTVYPRLEHYVALIPPTKFKTVVLVSDVRLPQALYLRIGMKRMGLFKVYLREAEIYKRVKEPLWTSIPVNLHDAGLFGYTFIDVMKVMETRSKIPGKPLASVIGYARSRNLFLIKSGKEEYRLPLPLKLVEDIP